ncbi:uncharacterized protein F5147DRAFT_656986 [Suillus discolor]|uniref:Uncharacterized protein n=1 Tax=Suillus discolor TaxID=1912936 RepID=A0A9P7EYD1_9AGAM|nr:uncharacterized protein F5147DRAFT_656986 [Suillus discolor]KAG2095101.1 hypothetical protein F5147DRAFT_656986 [Suillus discolor]
MNLFFFIAFLIGPFWYLRSTSASSLSVLPCAFDTPTQTQLPSSQPHTQQIYFLPYLFKEHPTLEWFSAKKGRERATASSDEKEVGEWRMKDMPDPQGHLWTVMDLYNVDDVPVVVPIGFNSAIGVGDWCWGIDCNKKMLSITFSLGFHREWFIIIGKHKLDNCRVESSWHCCRVYYFTFGSYVISRCLVLLQEIAEVNVRPYYCLALPGLSVICAPVVWYHAVYINPQHGSTECYATNEFGPFSAVVLAALGVCPVAGCNDREGSGLSLTCHANLFICHNGVHTSICPIGNDGQVIDWLNIVTTLKLILIRSPG